MRIKDRIANRILEYLEENINLGSFEIKEEEYLTIECGVADLIEKEISDWLRYDTDFKEISED